MEFWIGNYSNDAYFRYEVYPGVVQVPVNTLGKTRYTDEQMKEISRLDIADRQKLISNLCEAIQLFQVSNFRGVLDNRDFFIGSVHWQTHKSLKDAVLSNEGCCATDTNWLSFFLKGKYDFIGSFCFGCPDQNGHITTYILHDGFYYFIDMMMCRRDSQAFFDRKNVPPSQRSKQEWGGLLYCCKDPVQMCRFYIDRCRAVGRAVPYCFFLRETDQVTATGVSCNESGNVTFFAPECDRSKLLFLEAALGHGFSVVPLPDFGLSMGGASALSKQQE